MVRTLTGAPCEGIVLTVKGVKLAYGGLDGGGILSMLAIFTP